MKETVGHLPKNKQGELGRIVSVIRGQCNDVEMIILFGSYARGNYKEKADLKLDRKSGHVSDYDILVVTKEKSTAVDIGLWNNIAGKCNDSGPSAHVRIITHDIQELNIKLAEGQYFYSDVKKEGCMLYDSGNFTLAKKRKLKPEEKKRIAQDYFDHWFKTAQGSFASYKKIFEIKEYNWAAFHLHQTTEHSYKTILLVFENYNPNEHLLGLLGDMVAEHDSVLLNIFPQKTREEKDRFELLDYAYIGARYDPDYRISKEDLEYLAERVEFLLRLTEKICKTKIKSFTEKDK